MDVLKVLLKHEASRTVSFERPYARFMYKGRAHRGLTVVIGHLMALDEHDATRCSGCAAIAAHSRSTAFARSTSLVGGRAARPGVLFQSRKRLRAGDGEMAPEVAMHSGGALLPPPAATLDMYAAAAAAAAISTRHAPTCKGGRDACSHGKIVDDEVQQYVASRRRCDVTAFDACTRQLIAYIEKTLKWLPVATQVPMYSRRLNVATAIDLLCVDAATRTKLYLVEIKATRDTREPAAALSRCYKYVSDDHDQVVPALCDLDASRYSQHQLQLWAMAYALRRDLGVPIAGAVVLRTSPKTVFRYKLDAWFDSHERALLAAFAAKKAK